MKKKWTLTDQLNRHFIADIVVTIIVSVAFIIAGVAVCITDQQSLWLGLLFLGLGIFGAICSSIAIMILLKDKERDESEEVEKGKMLYLALEAQRMKEETEKADKARIEYLEREIKRMKAEQEKRGYPKTIDDNDRDDEI